MSDHASLSAHLLCAVPQLLDPNFERAVVLMLEHTDEGSLGLVLTDEMPTSLEEVLEGLDLEWDGHPGTAVRKGGPVEPSRGWILHNTPDWDPSAQEVLGGLWLTTSLDQIDRERGVGEGRFMFLLGYAGWGPRQLEEEIATGSWVAVPVGAARTPFVPPGWLFDVPAEELWGKALGVVGIDPARLVGLPSREATLH